MEEKLNGKEFQNGHFQTFCQENGIKHQFTIPYNPSQNGRAERFNGILISSAKALLNEAKLSHEFWEYVIDTANFIHNRLPSQSNQNRIPYEVFYNKLLDYSIYRVFGCKVYFFIPKELRSKFNNNSHPGIFLSYSNNTNGYKVYDIVNNKIILARTVEFMENEPGNSFINKYITNNEFGESANIKKLNQCNYYNKTDNKKNKTNECIFDKNINSNNHKDVNTYKNINQYINKHNDKNNNSNNINHNDNTTITNKTNISTIRNKSTNNNNIFNIITQKVLIMNFTTQWKTTTSINQQILRRKLILFNNKYKENNEDKSDYFF